MSFPRYPSYKNSGVEWLGEVPEHWGVQPFKQQIDRNDGGVWGDDPDGIDDTIVLRSTEQTVDGNWKLDDPASRKLSASEISGAMLAENDLLLTKSSGSSLHIGKTTLVTAEIAAMRCCYSNFMQRIRMKPSFLPKLAWHLMNNNLARLQFDLLSNSSTGLANLNATMVGQIVVPIAPLPEQTQIAAFLDRETGKIDALVAEQQRLMELLKEKRQAVISHAVTKGLNPNAPMKPSGIEWLGDVPEHWEVTAIKRFTDTITDGAHISPDTENGVFHFVSTKDVYDDSIDFENSLLTSNTSFDYMVKSGCRPLQGDVLFSKDGTIGRTVVVKEDRDFVVASSLIIIRPTKSVLDSEFLNCLCQSQVVASQVESLVKGAGLPRLSVQNLVKVFGCFPPLGEQVAVAGFLKRELGKFDTLTTEAKNAIDLLKERRTALISSAVTGQIDVRHLA